MESFFLFVSMLWHVSFLCPLYTNNIITFMDVLSIVVQHLHVVEGCKRSKKLLTGTYNNNYEF